MSDLARTRHTLDALPAHVVAYAEYIPTRAEEIAWATGLFDGKRTITLCGDALHVWMRNTGVELIERFHDVIRVGSVYGPFTRDERDGYRRKPFWDRVAREEDGLDTLALMWGWRSARRQARAQDVSGVVFTCFEEAARQLLAQEVVTLPPRPERGA